ncbi:MAG TPA: bifunctional acetate--CoA ligase family protein/GNAT family N-acetyltransferase [Ktedonosporobacter sp.]|jgi:acetyltransferase|nr:bifunctional acetate--CoA ligase family protein/GNAT family N-acetyltransferase [Ktedonosporobacter sp.]
MEAHQVGTASIPGRKTPTNIFWYQQHHPLNVFFQPKSIAVIGATEKAGSVGRTILWNLISNPFGGTVFPVNPRHASVLGIKAYPHLAALPQQVDLAIIVTPAPTVPGLIAECVDAGVKGAIIISAGFKEKGAEGAYLEQQILEQARRGNLRIIGPNCLGVMSPLTGLNATFAHIMARPGNVAFISQSGALCTAVLDWSISENVGFSAFISIGSMVDVGWGDLIEYLGSDGYTKSIVIYMETIGDARSFLSSVREVARTKPIIIIKAGRTQAAAQAAASHTGALTGSQEVFDAACRRCGVLSVNRIDELFSMADVLAKQPRPRGPHLTILTNAGGPGVLATDALLTTGGTLAELSPQTLTALDRVLPAHWSHANPVDILGDADPERYAKALEIAAQDPNSDGLLVILTPQAMTDPTLTAEYLKRYATTTGKPILASWMGGASVTAGHTILNQVGIPTFAYPDTAAQAFNYMWHYVFNLRGIYETPLPSPQLDHDGPDKASATKMIEAARQSGRTILTEVESKQLLAAYGIPTVETRVATSETEAVTCAEAIGYPVVLKLFSKTITHKTDVGGVQLNLSGADSVRHAYQAIAAAVRDNVGAEHFLGVTVQPMISLDGYELILGSSPDPQFGPVLLFGSGGQLVAVYRDRAIALPPLNTTLALRMMEQTRILSALKGVRGRPPVDLTALEHLLVRFSSLVVEQRRIKEIDINPLLASPDRLLALDARVVLHDPETCEDALPQLAIRPYPLQYVQPWTLLDGTPVTLRPILAEDEPLMIKFHQSLSERSVYFRWLHMLGLSQRTAHERLIGVCFIDYDREMAFVADHLHPDTGQHEILGVGRIIKIRNTDEAEFALLIADQFQRKGLGTELLRRLIQFGRDEKLQRLTGDILVENNGMQEVCKKLGFRLEFSPEQEVMKAELEL